MDLAELGGWAVRELGKLLASALGGKKYMWGNGKRPSRSYIIE